jgi:hypothetical protein
MKNKFTDIDIEAFILSNNKDADFKSLPEMTMEYAEYVKHPSHPVGDYKAVWIESSLKHSIFIKTLKEITKEKEYSAKLLRDFATAPFKYFDGDAEKVTLSMLNQKLIGLLVRYQRANAIANLSLFLVFILSYLKQFVVTIIGFKLNVILSLFYNLCY